MPVLQDEYSRSMAVSKPVVFFSPAERCREAVGLALEASGFFSRLRPGRKVGMKVHFGEAGNSNHLDPQLVRAASLALSRHNLQPVAIETTALYRGRRQNAREHLELAREHGFTLQNILAPIEILDGERGEAFYVVPLESTIVPRAKLARGLRRYHYVLNLAHFKGHFVAGFGGALKNLAMGLAAKAGKLEMHSSSHPYVESDKCNSCGDCVEYCPHEAISYVRYVAKIGRNCAGCGGCLAVCPKGAIRVNWNAASELVQLKMAEYCRAVLLGRQAFHFNFCLKVTPNCDCNNRTEQTVMPDAGVFASLDPVACEQAAYDRVGPKLKELYPHLKPETLLDACVQNGTGTREYELVEL